MVVRYILHTVCLRCSVFSLSPFAVYRVKSYQVIHFISTIRTIYLLLHLIIILKSQVLILGHCYKGIEELMQERRNSIANELELRMSCTNPSEWYMMLVFLLSYCWQADIFIMESTLRELYVRLTTSVQCRHCDIHICIIINHTLWTEINLANGLPF